MIGASPWAGPVAVIVCCAGPTLAAGLVGGAALAAIRRFTPVAVIFLGLIIVFAGRLARRRARWATPDSTSMAAISTPREETPR